MVCRHCTKIVDCGRFTLCPYVFVDWAGIIKLVLQSHSMLSQTPSHGIKLHYGPLPCAKTVASLCVRAPGRKRTTSCVERHPRTTASWKWRPAPSTQTLSARTAWAHLPSASRDLSSPALMQTLPHGYYEKPAAPRVQKVQKRGRESSSLQSIKIDCSLEMTPHRILN